MSDSYTGWDGKTYPWPPPEGWYEASDGRWWAPGTGPNPPPETPAPPSHPESSYSPGDFGERFDDPGGFEGRFDDPPSEETPTTALSRSSRDTSPFGSPSGGPGTSSSRPDFGSTAAFPASDPPTTPTTGGGPHSGQFGDPPTAQSPAVDGGTHPPTSASAPSPASLGEERRSSVGLVLAVVIALVVLGGGGYLLLSGGDEEDSASGAETTDDDSATTSEGDTDTAAGAAADDSSPTPTTDDTGDTDDTSGADDPADDETADDTSTTLAADPTQIDQFRSLLRENGLTSDKLADADVLGFGSSFCALAASSSSPEVFDEFRQDAIDSTANTSLDPGELGMVIDSAILAFCPDEADRLAIGA
jgi:hypothetical protein